MDTYRATNTLNGKFYIGSTTNFEQRKYQHLRGKENYPFQSDLRKNPEAFVWEVYTDNLDTNEHEVRLLREFFFDVKCYNLNHDAKRPPSQKGKKHWKNELTQKQVLSFEKPEGEGWEKGFLQKTVEKKSGFRHTEEAKKKISEAQSGEKNSQFGVPRTEETKKKMSEAQSGRTFTEEHKRKISEANSGEKNYQFGVPRTEEVKKKISEALSGRTLTEETKKKMSEAKSGEKHPHYGRTGEKHPQYGRTGALHHSSKAIIAIKPDGTKLHFGGGREAARKLEVHGGTVAKYLRSGHVLAKGNFKGWQFIYKNSEVLN